MGKAIKQYRRKLNLSQKQLAKIAMVSQSTISRLETDCATTNYQVVYKIMLYLKARSFDNETLNQHLINPNSLEFMMRVIDNPRTRQLINCRPSAAARLLSSALSKTNAGF